MRKLVIGDIHGGYKGMIQALQRAEFNKEVDTLISLGDIADGWSETAECVEYLLSCKNLIAIRGNHDMWCRNWLIFGEVQRVWKDQGGKATIESYMKIFKEVSADTIERHREFFKNQVNYYIDEKNRGFVHGGYTSWKGLGNEPYESNYFWDRDLWNLAYLQDSNGIDTNEPRSSYRFLKHFEIFIGHTTTMNWQTDKPMHKCNVWNLDTGGGYQGKITVMDVDTKEYWQSDLMPTLYPNDKGRN